MSEELGKQICKSMSVGETFQTEPTVGARALGRAGCTLPASSRCGGLSGVEYKRGSWEKGKKGAGHGSPWGFLSQEMTEITDPLWAVAFNQSSLAKSS